MTSKTMNGSLETRGALTSRGVIFWRSLRDARWIVLGWGIVIGLFTLFVILLFPTITQFEGMAQMLESPIYRAFLGDAADAAAFLTPPGFYAIYVVAFTPLYIAIYMVLLGIGATAGEEDRGTLDLLLTTPTPRWQLVTEKFLAIIVIVVLLLVINSAFAVLGIALTPEMTISFSQIAASTLAMVPISVLIAAIALFLATLLRSRFLAGALTGVLIVGSYLVTTLSTVATDALGTLKYLSFYTYHRSVTIMNEGIQWGDFLLLTAATIILFALAVFAFQRRDIHA